MSIIETVIDAKTLEDLVKVEVKEIPKEPKLTADKVNAVVEMLKDIEINNGYVAIADANGVSVERVKEIHKKMLAKIAELTPKVSGEITEKL